MPAHVVEHNGLTPTRLAGDPGLWPSPSPGGSRHCGTTLDEQRRLFDRRRLR